MPAHPRLISFFNGAIAELRAAYTMSEGAPTAAMGASRETAVMRALRHSIPSVAAIHSGEVIDPYGGQSGQLDGIVVHATGSALATTPDAERIALAEGVIAVIESKSTLTSQWDDVKLTCSKVAKLRRPAAMGISVGGFPQPSEARIPFVAIGRTGWAKADTLKEKAVDLSATYTDDATAPLVVVVQLEPHPGIAWHLPVGADTRTSGALFSNAQDEGTPLAYLWWHLGVAVQRVVTRPIDWAAYVNGTPTL